ncbi:hypothetical protein Tco_0823792 [Tanacetum coccineum]|uniref:Uncharacterized protein n=1 Tax=Tanacetum coccineum TaxID=301880 RepID=A0ABQ5AN14_9ASTR
MSTHEQHTPTIPTSAMRNTGGRRGPQGLEEPTPDETPTAGAEPRRRHGNRPSRSPLPIASVFKRLKQNRPPSPRPRPRKEGCVFNRLGGKERSASTRSDSRHQNSHEKETEVQPRKHHHRGTSSRGTSGHSESEDSEGGHWKSKSKMPCQHLRTLILYSALDVIHGGLYGKIQSRNPRRGRSAVMHEDLRIYAWYNPPRADQAFIQENSEINGQDVQDRFSLLMKTPKEIFALEKGKFKAPPPMVTSAEKRDPNKYCEFHVDTGHNTDECIQLRKQIDQMIKSGKLSQFIKELKQNDKPKAPKKGKQLERISP